MTIARSVADVLRLAPCSGAYRARFAGPPNVSLDLPWEVWTLDANKRLWQAPDKFAGHQTGCYDEAMIDYEIVGPIAEPD